MAKRKPTPATCQRCGISVSRKADLARHQKLHAPNREDLLFVCPYRDNGCPYATLQMSNLTTHLNVIHYNHKPHKCPDCRYRTGDPSGFTRHRQDHHNYKAKGPSSETQDLETNEATLNRRAARRSRKYAPYTPSSSLNGSLVPSPTPGSSSSSLSFADHSTGDGNNDAAHNYSSTSSMTQDDGLRVAQNTTAQDTNDSLTYISPLTTSTPQANTFHIAPNTYTQATNNSGIYNDPLTTSLLQTYGPQIPRSVHTQGVQDFGLSAALERTTPDLLQPYYQGSAYATYAAAQPVCDMSVTEEVFNNFLAKFGDYQPPSSMPSYSVGDVTVPTAATIPQHAIDGPMAPEPAFLFPYCEDQYNTTASTSVHTYGAPHTARNASYEYRGYATEPVPLHTQTSQPDPLDSLDFGLYPWAAYNWDINSGYWDSYSTHTGTSGPAMQGHYAN